MIRLMLCSLFVGIFSGHIIASASWKLEMPDDLIVVSSVAQVNSIVFWSTGDQIGGKSIETGKDIWSVNLEDWNPDGPEVYSEDTYITIDNDYLVAYDIFTGDIRWSLELQDIEANEYKLSFFPSPDRFVIAFGSLHFAIDIYSGNILWSQSIHHREFSEGEQLYQTYASSSENYFAVLVNSKDMIYTIEVESGAVRGSQIDFIPQSQSMERLGAYSVPLRQTGYTAFVGEEKIVIVNDTSGNIETYLKGLPPKSFSPIAYQADGSILVMTDEKVVWITTAGKITDLKMGYEDFRVLETIKYLGRDYIAMSYVGGIAIIDPQTGHRVWTSGFEESEDGYIHDFIGIVDGQLIAGYSDNSIFSGTWVRLYSYDMKTGQQNWVTPDLLASKSNINDLNRWIGDSYNPNSPMSWTNPGFKYSSGITAKGDVWLASSWAAQPEIPEDMEGEDGNGLVLINSNDGTVLSSDYIELNEEYNYTDAAYLVSPFAVDSIIYLIGTTHIAAYSATNGQQLWLREYISGDEDEYTIVEARVQNDVLVLRSGGVKQDIYMTKPVVAAWFTSPSVSTNELWSSEPTAILGVSVKDGSLLWKNLLDGYPEDIIKNYSIQNWTNNNDNSLMIADRKGVTQIDIRSGTVLSGFDLDKYEMEDLDESYAIQTFPLFSVRETKSYYHGYYYDWEVTSTYTNLYDENISLMERALRRSDASIVYEQFGNTWGGTATRVLGAWNTPWGLYIAGQKAQGMIDRETGIEKWSLKWEFDEDDFGFAPMAVGEIIFYEFDNRLNVLSLTNGKILFEEEVDDNTQYLVSHDQKYLIAYSEDILQVLKL